MSERDNLVRPTPIRPGRTTRQASGDMDNDDERPLRTYSHTDLRGMSRTSSLLSLSGLAERSSALFGIFEQGGGYDTEPVTPEAGAGARRYELRSTTRIDDEAKARLGEQAAAQARTSSIIQDVLRVVVLLTTSYLFIILFNRLPSTNKFCAITSAENISPLLYCLAATSTSIIFSTASHATRASSVVRAVADREEEEDDDDHDSHTEKSGKVASSGETNLIIRWFAGFLGLAYAGTKLDYSNAWQFNGCVAAVATGCLVVVDRTVRGFLISLGLALVGTAAYTSILRPEADMLPGVFVLVWLNVAVYGCLGKMMGLLRHRQLLV